jgi:uncharacterized membrane protein YhdT
MVEQYDNYPGTIDSDKIFRDTKIPELQYGEVNFDNIFLAFLTVFQCLTLEGWVAIMYNYQDSSGTYTAALYFVAYVLVCAILFMNIIVAVLFDNYDDSEEEKKDEDLIELEEKAIDLGIPEGVRDIIIRNDIIIGLI